MLDEKIREVATELGALGGMCMADLHAKYREVFNETSTSRNAAWLRKKIAYRIQELAEGGLSARALRRIEQLADGSPLTTRGAPPAASSAADEPSAPGPLAPDPRRPAVGTVLKKIHGGKEHVVTIVAGGFEYRGRLYTSLSPIARTITGTNWNGWRFFGIDAKPRSAA